jgi:hypothetical protein
MRTVGEVLWWSVAGVVIWLLTLSSVSVPELVLAGASSLMCAGAAVAGRKLLGATWRFRPGWLRWLVSLPTAVAADTVRILGVPVRTSGRSDDAGYFRSYQVKCQVDRPTQEAWEALAVIAVSATPGAFVVDIQQGRDGSTITLLTHSLTAGGPDMAEVIRR